MRLKLNLNKIHADFSCDTESDELDQRTLEDNICVVDRST